MYEFSDAIDKVNFDEEFSDVADNIKNDCWQLESMNFSDAVAKINEWIDRVFNPCKCSIIDYPEWFKIVVWRVLYNELKANPQARQTELIEDNINLPKDVFGKKYWNMYSPDMKLQQEEYLILSCKLLNEIGVVTNAVATFLRVLILSAMFFR